MPGEDLRGGEKFVRSLNFDGDKPNKTFSRTGISSEKLPVNKYILFGNPVSGQMRVRTSGEEVQNRLFEVLEAKTTIFDTRDDVREVGQKDKVRSFLIGIMSENT